MVTVAPKRPTNVLTEIFKVPARGNFSGKIFLSFSTCFREVFQFPKVDVALTAGQTELDENMILRHLILQLLA
jgi:hypothetical protein